VVPHGLVDVEIGAGGASKPVSSLSNTTSSFIFAGSLVNSALARSS
jgi:hypothetical protein